MLHFTHHPTFRCIRREPVFSHLFLHWIWQEPNTLHASLLQPPRLHVRPSPVRPSVRLLAHPKEVSRKSEDPSKEQSPLVKSRSIKRPLISWSESSHSPSSSENSSKATTNKTSDSKVSPSRLSRKLLRTISSTSSLTPSSVPNTPSVSPSCNQTCSSPPESEAASNQTRRSDCTININWFSNYIFTSVYSKSVFCE